jgi:hypothetical protein
LQPKPRLKQTVFGNGLKASLRAKVKVFLLQPFIQEVGQQYQGKLLVFNPKDEVSAHR